MNILHGSAILMDWFLNQDSFNFKKDFPKLVKDSKTPEEDTAAILCSLNSLKLMGYIENIKLGVDNSVDNSVDNNYWILVKPLKLYNTTLVLSGETTSKISHIINSYCNIIGTDLISDPRNITEFDIQNLLFIVHAIVSESTEENPQSETKVKKDKTKKDLGNEVI